VPTELCDDDKPVWCRALYSESQLRSKPEEAPLGIRHAYTPFNRAVRLKAHRSGGRLLVRNIAYGSGVVYPKQTQQPLDPMCSYQFKKEVFTPKRYVDRQPTWRYLADIFANDAHRFPEVLNHAASLRRITDCQNEELTIEIAGRESYQSNVFAIKTNHLVLPQVVQSSAQAKATLLDAIKAANRSAAALTTSFEKLTETGRDKKKEKEKRLFQTEDASIQLYWNALDGAFYELTEAINDVADLNRALEAWTVAIRRSVFKAWDHHLLSRSPNPSALSSAYTSLFYGLPGADSESVW